MAHTIGPFKIKNVHVDKGGGHGGVRTLTLQRYGFYPFDIHMEPEECSSLQEGDNLNISFDFTDVSEDSSCKICEHYNGDETGVCLVDPDVTTVTSANKGRLCPSFKHKDKEKKGINWSQWSG